MASISDSDDDIPGEEFGQYRPPLSEIIRSILDRYPDGQIFKEIIQNADDAGAKQVKFFIDHRQHGTCSLPNKKLGNCQGPALISANDAQFSKEDWVGIHKLQRSIKAKDPFKVGKFGIGFNSVYHITDVPTIVSGERVAYLEPQEQIWHGRPGRSYTLDYLRSKGVDALRPFDGIFSFNISSSSYPHTLFRFPLRTVASSLSQNIYTTEKIEELIDALKQEAKLLLLFLRSVNSIEVYDIFENGEHSLLFKTCIADSIKAEVERKRSNFNRKLRDAYQHESYQVSSIISYTNRFQVEVTDCVSSHLSRHDWLVVNQVGSHVHKVLEASSQQSTFPLVGVALELNQNLEGGRIFCFLPMPVETASGLPVHINGTFGLTDDRRSLKWPSVERKNDPTANWNQLLVKELLPSCYFTLAIQAKDLLQPEQFYNVWPVPSSIKYSQWGVILQPFFERLFLESVVFSSLSNKWVSVAQQSTVFVPCNENLPTIVYKVLSSCGLNVVVVPSQVWEALRHVGRVVTEVTHGLVRGMLRSKPQSYTYLSHSEKQNLLMYCLADKQYSDLQGIQLIPLANGQFTSFQCIHQYYGVSHVYLCSSEFPKYLLPNLDHKLVDILENPQLYTGLCKVANSKVTNLFHLTEESVASLLTEAMPYEWNQRNDVSLPHQNFPTAWFKQFWQWVQNRNLDPFKGMLVVPISSPGTQPITDSFHVVRLSATQSILYIPSHVECSIPLQNALTKLQVKYCMQQHYPYFSHKQLLKYLAKYDPQNLLNAVYQASHYNGVNFKEEEAEQLRTFLCSSSISSYNLNYQHRYVLENMAIFKTAANSNEQLCSIASANSNSIAKKALLLQANFNLSFANLPSNLLLFTQHSHNQTTLLQQYLNVTIISDVDLLVSYIFPLISKSLFPNLLINPLMKEVLDLFNIFQLKNSSFATKVKSLPFIDTDSSNQQKKCPSDLFDPSVAIIARLYMGKNVFPREPFNTAKCLQILRQCGLHVTVTPQEVLNIVSEMCATQSSFLGKVDLSRCNAVLSYIGSREFQYPYSTYCNFKGVGKQHFLTFNSAINYLAKAASWLPVMTDPPTGYPHCLPWRGKGYNVTSLNNDVVVVGPNEDVSCLVGSQMFIVSVDSQAVANLFEKPKLTQHALTHFEEIIKYKDELSRDVLNQLVINMYEKLNTYDTRDMNRLHLIHEWIYLQKYNMFVSPTVVALNQNPTFRHNLEPYLYVLPESLSKYSALFKRFGVETNMTQSQILSVLENIKNHIFSENDSSNAWYMVMSVLNWITKNGTEEATLSSNETLYVPIESESTWPELKDSSNVVYTDNDFMKDFLLTCGSDETFTFVDSRISQRMAECLGLTPLSEHLDISEDTFEDSGQHEPLTVRLKNILRDYKDGLTIVKELLQNADDAEATEVNICYDARTHTVSRKSLFFPGMLDSHGPALLVHNNKSFTKEDFKNITKLAGATKQNKHLKIGKFGVGFCSVYHITDVPSFVSEDKLCIFDPTLSALRKEVKNPSQPGKKVKFTSRFIARSSQLLPYEGLFGFQSGKPYKGTLFRFPFRSCASELSGTCYTRATVDELLSDIEKSGSKLLLFLQHVKKVTFQVIDKGDQTPKLLLTITKVNKNQQTHATKPTNTKIVRCDIEAHPSKQVQVENWVVSSDSSVIFTKNATASVACEINLAHPSSSNYSSIVELDGELFCFLPLSQKTGLPVHVSSNFAVINNRRGIWTADDATSKTDTEVQWNVALMQNVIPRAYLNLLCVLQDMNQHSMLHTYSFYCLWPLAAKLLQRNPWHLMVNELYKMISTTSETLFYSNCSKMWLTLSGSKFLQHGILSHTTSVMEAPECIQKTVLNLNEPIVKLPEEYGVHLLLSEDSKHIITEKHFIQLFFEKVSLNSFTEDCKNRNLVIIHMLEVYATEYDEKTNRYCTLEKVLTTQACVPCASSGTMLRHCKDVVSPNAPFAGLFDSNEARFPIKEFTERHLVYSALCNLGMICNELPWELLMERAQTISTLYKRDQTKALNRAALIIRTLNECMTIPQSTPTFNPTIDSIDFLPVLTKPQDYQLSWCGEECKLSSGRHLLVAQTIVRGRVTNNAMICSSQVMFVCEDTPEFGGCGHITSNTLKLLHIRTSPTCEEVIKHFKSVVKYYSTTKKQTKDMKDWCNQLCMQVYAYFDALIGEFEQSSTDDNVVISALPKIDELLTFACIWNGEAFLDVSSVAKLWKMNGPYLYPVPATLEYWQRLSTFLDIKDEFSVDDIQQTLIKMKEDFGDNPVNEQCQTFLKELVPILDRCEMDQYSGDFKILLPDESFILRWSTHLTYNDTPWAPKDSSCTYINEFISRALAEKLGVKTAGSRFLKKFESIVATHFSSSGVPFGQKEELTRRISNIIRDYPFDVTVLKELLQNADDAKATKMYVILDKRTHGTQSVFSEAWQKLQGPALLVWNDSTFSEKDLQGIQELGLGSKRSDAESIGQYGIGFNVVYHLTDCPSFVTGGETLCIMDPHCKFVPGADPLNPGRRYDNLSSGLWKKFPDVKSAHLQSKLENSPPELSGGSLFRFPLRCTIDLIKSSQIVEQSINQPLTVEDMHQHLSAWAPIIKNAMLFLNHVTELKFFIIEKDSKVIMIEHHFRTTVSTSYQKQRDQFHKDVSQFKNETDEVPQVVMYPLTMRNIKNSGTTEEKYVEEKWLIQQGIGDIENHHQHWQFIRKLKPRHGIAAPIPHMKSLKSKRNELEDYERQKQTCGNDKQKKTVLKLKKVIPSKSYKTKDGGVSQLAASTAKLEQPPSKKPNEFSGRVFRFLPLPLGSKLPVHINGNFMLDSNRRDLWHGTEPEVADELSKWNNSLILAIASSYAKFLVDCKEFYVLEHNHSASIKNYYQLFPRLTSTKFNQPWLELARTVFKKLYKNNMSCLAVVEPKSQLIQWHHPTCSSPEQQVYIWKSRLSYYEYDYKVIRPILRKLGIIISSAPYRIKECFDTIIDKNEKELPEITPSSVYKHYKCLMSCSFPETPCVIEDTPFQTLSNFKAFTKYLLQYNQEKHVNEFSSDPYKIPLLLTNDGILRCFDEHHKAILSKYCQLFPRNKDRFLHIKLTDLNYSGEYFVQCEIPSASDDKLNVYARKLVFEILDQALPSCMKGTRTVESYHQFISKSFLTSLWKCLKNDPTFRFYLSSILDNWSLLATIGSCLYSRQSSILPVIPRDPTDPVVFVRELFREIEAPSSLSQSSTISECEDPYFNVSKLLHEMRMPFLDTGVVVCHSTTTCPYLGKYSCILMNIYFLHQCNDLSKTFTKESVQILINYLKKIDFRNDDLSRKRLKSLPLFQTVDSEGQFSSIQGKDAFLWPEHVCISGCKKWLKEYSDAVFVVKHDIDWTALGSAEQLGIKYISPECLYVKFIFPKFDCMMQTERYEHLRYIRDNLLDNVIVKVNRHTSMYNDSEEKRQAEVFFGAIKSLPCLGGDHEILKPVTDFYSHKEKLFLTFDDEFLFLPEYFTKYCDEEESTRWLNFFVKIELNESPTTDEYLRLCKKVEESQKSNVLEASMVLTRYLFSTKAQELGWHDDQPFLHSVSLICFVCLKQLKNLVWIKPTVSSTKQIVTKDGKVIEMASFCGAAADIDDSAILLWTVKPVVQLPKNDGMHMTINFEDRVALLQALNVCVLPHVKDVIANIRNICQDSPFASNTLFYTYPENLRCPFQIDLLKILEINFKFLTKHHDPTACSESNIELLKELPCVPVYSTPKGIPTRQVVLVKPKCVLKCDSQRYHPLLHSLPDDLYSVVMLMQTIGVKNAIELSHLQLVLELAFKGAEQQVVDINTYKCIQYALKDLYELLQTDHRKPTDHQMVDSEIADALCPLYLPSEGRRLALSTDLVYCDKTSYKGTSELSFGKIDAKFLSLPVAEYEFYESNFCQLLPKTIRPLGLSEICKQSMDTDCKAVGDCKFAVQLKQALSILMLAKAIVSVAKHFTQNKEVCANMEPHLFAFISNLDVITVQNLKSEISHRESGAIIGKVKVDSFFLESESEKRLFLDSQISNIAKEYVIKDLAEIMLSKLGQFLPVKEIQMTSKMLEVFMLLLRAESSNDVKEILRMEKIVIDGIPMDTMVCELGSQMPDCWKCRLHCDSNNVFIPNEYVGYDMNGEIILAQIVHAVLPQGVESFNSIPHSKMIYKICTDKDDEDGIDVSVVSLSKFLPADTSHEPSIAESVYCGTIGTNLPSIDSADVRKCKKKVDYALRKIWKLPHDEKMEAVEQLYFKLHPERNSHNVLFAEEVFKYFILQIKILDDATSSEKPEWKQKFRQLDSDIQDNRKSDDKNTGGLNYSGPCSAEKDPEKGRRWIQQAKVDFRALCALHDQLRSHPELAGHVCFMAHQVAEKALKGGRFAVGNDDEGILFDHELRRHACALETDSLQIATFVAPFELRNNYYYLDTRYPNRSPSPKIPAEMFDENTANDAKKSAGQVLKIVESLISE